MNVCESWLGRKKASLCILIGVCAISLCVILFYREQGRGIGGEFYAVSIRHYGIDAREMERNVAIPLEDALSAISGVHSVQSSSENSLARVFVRFGRNSRGQYEAVRDAAQRVYESLPSSAQRPEIQSSGNSRIPVWSAAVFDTRNSTAADTALLLERIVKPRLESLEGTGEVLVSGVGLREIIVALDQEKAAILGLNPSMVSAALAMNDALFPAGILAYQGRDVIVTVDGRYFQSTGKDIFNRITDEPAALENAFIPLGGGKTVKLGEIASIYEQERVPDTIARLNGKKAAVLSLMGSSGADLRKLSRDIQKELSLLPLPLEFTVLSDRGAEEALAFRSVFSATLQGAFMVALMSFLLNRRKENCFPLRMNHAAVFSALSVPVVCIVSASVLAITGFQTDRFVLAGLAAGIGAAVDPVILCSEKLRKSRNYNSARSALGEIRGPLIAGAATTVAALLPLRAMEIEVTIIAYAITIVTLAALVLSLGLLPPLLLWHLNSPKTQWKMPLHLTILSPVLPNCSSLSAGPLTKTTWIFLCLRHFCNRAFRRISRIVYRFLAVDALLCVRHPFRIVLAAAVVSAAGVLALVIRGVDSGTYGSENSLYAQVEFEGGLLSGETDRLLAEYGKTLAEKDGIIYAETGARTGMGSLLLSFDPKQITADKVRELARSIAIPGGFVFFPETAVNERYWEIKISGDDDKKCRELAETLSRISAGLPLVKDRVLNFKEGSKKLVLFPDRERLAESRISFLQTADAARRGVHGPVSYKRTGPQGEIDVRLRTGTEEPSRTKILGILVSPQHRESKALYLDSLVRTGEDLEPASIRREDRRRVASITLSTKAMDPRRVKKYLANMFEKLELPPGYAIEFDPEAIRRAEALSGTFLSLLLALAFCFMVIAAVNESFVMPLAILAAVPPSLTFPALCLAVFGGSFNLSAACAFVAVSGMTVNAAVLCADGIKTLPQSAPEIKSLCLYRTLRRKMPALFATAGTTIAGALPFLLLRERANDMVRTLSLVTALGVAGSCICSISVVPAFSLFLKNSTLSLLSSKTFSLVRKTKSNLGYTS
jgi:multidrug efflux pump subunit AcrB